MDMAADAAGVGIWEWDIARNDVWMSSRGRALFGFAPSEPIDIDRFLAVLHPEERRSVRTAIAQSQETGGSFEREYRVLLPRR
jgi:PAS domain-containing protein